MKINILSPHIDDAGYCLALTISALINQNIPVSIINCFTITKWTIVFVSKDINEVTLIRKNEDIEFYKSYKVPVPIVNLDLLDAPLRNGFIFNEKPFEEIEWKVVEELKVRLDTEFNGILFCPLAIGNHVDHQICREAVIQLYENRKVIFFEDLPYANRISESEICLHVAQLEDRLKVKLTSHVHVPQNCTLNKEQCVRLYKSQLTDEICGEIISHFNNLRGERLWGEAETIEAIKLYL